MSMLCISSKYLLPVYMITNNPYLYLGGKKNIWVDLTNTNNMISQLSHAVNEIHDAKQVLCFFF